NALRRREYATYQVSSRVRLTKTPAQYRASRDVRRELPYEAMIAAGRLDWRRGDKVRWYRTSNGSAGLVSENDPADARAYDIDHYLRVLRDNYASRLARAFTPADFATLFAHPDQQSLFAAAYEEI